MAVFGQVGSLPLPDILCFLAARGRGLFHVSRTASGCTYRLDLREGLLTGFAVGKDEVRDTLQVRQKMVDLLAETEGDFHYEPTERLRKTLSLPINQLLISALVVVDELKSYAAYLPSAETEFRATDARGLWLDSELSNFWTRFQELLYRGTTALRLADASRLSTTQVCLFLFKLRSAGVIEPVRRFQLRPPPTGLLGNQRMPNAAPATASGTAGFRAPHDAALNGRKPAPHERIRTLMTNLKARITGAA